MKNPWKEIPSLDYESHMKQVGQLQILSKITDELLTKYIPVKFGLLGCCTGNGLEHIDSDITKEIYAIDINKEYLRVTKDRFGNKLKGLNLLKIDISKEKLDIKDIDLLFVGLVLEYVDFQSIIDKLVNPLRASGILAIVIQKSGKEHFVSKTKYQSLENLSQISNEVDETILDLELKKRGLEFVNRKEIEVTNSKRFIQLEYKNK